MIEVLTTEPFDKWLEGLKDASLRRRVIDRIDRVSLGNSGDFKSIGGGIFELRLAFGAGYRIYYIKEGSRVVILLCGGDKSTQKKDIAKAKKIAKEVQDD